MSLYSGGGNKYSERVCKLLAGEDGIGSVVDTLAPAVVEYLAGMTRLPWGAQVLPEHSEHILRFALLAMEVSGLWVLLTLHISFHSI